MNQQRTPMTGPSPGSNRINVTSLLAGFALGAVLASLAWVQVVPEETATPDTAAAGNQQIVPLDPDQGIGPDGAADSVDDEGDGETRTTEVIQGGGGGGNQTAGDPGGAVDVGGGTGPGGGSGDGSGGPGFDGGGGEAAPGVSDNAIQFGATYVAEGLACDFLCEVRPAMEAVQNRVNSGDDDGEPGVHGRSIQIEFQNDGWDPTVGHGYIENLINQGVFAFAVSPSSEGLNSASEAGLFRDNQVPVVGADGLNNSQFIYTKTGEPNQWIWPVATATTTNVHIIMQDAYERAGDDLEPAIVFGNTYRFGVEGAYAFNAAYCRVTGGTMTGGGTCEGGETIEGYSPGETSCQPGSLYCGIEGNWSGGGQTTVVKDACDQHDCNFLLLLLEPATALNWMGDFQISPENLDHGMAGAQPLFTANFGDECGADCEGMVVWTGYKPASLFSQEDEVTQYTRELRNQKGDADIDNQFTMGGYIGMELLVEALEQAGRDLTRGKVVNALNSLALDTGLTAAGGLSWSAGNKYANNAAHGFAMTFNETQGNFTGFEQATDVVEDPWLGEDNQTP